jgi:pimeloyl-ACP methyl ester carboxylesterase
MTSGFIDLGDRTLEYAQVAGSVDRPTLLLLHEALGCVELWREFPMSLAERTGCQVIAYSRQGFGKSSPEPLPRPLSNLSEGAPAELGRVLDALELTSVILVGHSDGGTISLAYGARNDPRVMGIVCMAAHVFVEPITIDGVTAAVEIAKTNTLLEKLKNYHGEKNESVYRGWCGTWLDPDFRDWNLFEELPRIGVPVLAFQGADDQYGTAAQLEEIAARMIASCQTTLLKDCRHVPHREAPEETLRLIEAFVRSISV